MIRLGLLTLGDVPVTQVTARARLAESVGYDAFWVADERFFREPYQLLALAGAATKTIRLGPCVADPFTRHPALTAMAMATLDEATDGRAVLVYGAGKSGFSEMGIDRRRSATALREATHLVRTLLQDGEADVQGQIVRFRAGRMNLPTPRPVPIWIASEGPRTLELAGRIADGVMIGSTATPDEARPLVERVAAGAAEVSRSVPPIHVRLDIAIADDRSVALDAMRPVALRHLLRHLPDPGFAERHRLDAEFVAWLRSLDYRGYSRDAERVKEWARRLPDRLISPFAWAGTPADVQAAAAGLAPRVTGITVAPIPVPGQRWEDAAARIAEAVGPAFNARTRN